jgi:hypothetical protein
VLGIQHFWPEKRIFPSFLSNHHHMNVDASLHRPRRPIACRHQMRPALGMEGPFRGGKPPQANRAFQSGSTRDGRIDLTVDSLRPGPSEHAAYFVVRDHNGQALAYVYLRMNRAGESAENLMSMMRPADCGQYREVAGGIAAETGKLRGAMAKKIEPQFFAMFSFWSLTLAFYVLGSMRELTKAKPALSM